MLPLRYGRRWQTASILLLLFVLLAAVMPAVWFWDDKVKVLTWIRWLDKWMHGVTFLALTIWFAGLYRVRSYWRVALGLLLFGLLIEICQKLVGYRTADPFDVAADTAGIAVGLVVAIAGAGGWCLALENRLSKRSAGAGE